MEYLAGFEAIQIKGNPDPPGSAFRKYPRNFIGLLLVSRFTAPAQWSGHSCQPEKFYQHSQKKN